jgi:hypothetical protein
MYIESHNNIFVIVDIHLERAKKILKKGFKVPTKLYEMLMFKTTTHICNFNTSFVKFF